MNAKKSTTNPSIVSRADMEWEIVTNPYYKKRVQRLSSESCRILLNNREKAVEYARKGLEQFEPEKLTDEYIEIYANSMQTLARIILDNRLKRRNKLS